MSGRIGVLALQGDFAAHRAALARCGCQALEVRRPRQLEGLDGLVIPGGESTTLLHLLRDEPWFEALRTYKRDGGALLGTCAGAILLAERVTPSQASLGLLEIGVERNAYGRQVDSFATTLDSGLGAPLDALFIRAPRIRSCGARVEVLARLGGEPVLVRQDRVAAATFHPELSGDDRVHRWFAELATGQRAAA